MKDNIYKNSRGFTMVEILTVVGIVVIIATVALPYGSTFLAQNRLQESTLNIVDALRRVQSRSMSGMGGEPWGVHFTSADITLFKGTSYSPGDDYNELIELPDISTISTISLNGGGDDLIFNRVIGDTSEWGTIVIDDANSDSEATVTISGVGLIEYDYNL
jgi:prepilin-type N-terminal cleavage/methylation domain-containing protein